MKIRPELQVQTLRAVVPLALLCASSCSHSPISTTVTQPYSEAQNLSSLSSPSSISSFPLPSQPTSSASGYTAYGSDQNFLPPPASEVEATSSGAITFNFVDASVTAVAQTIFGRLLKENYTVDGGVQGTITLQTTRPLTVDEVIPALETSLQMANLALTHEADGYHIVPLASAAEAGAGNLSIAGGPAMPGYGYEIIPLRYADAASIEKLIQPLAQNNVQIQTDETHNLLIVAGTSQERAAIAANVAVFDVNWLAGMSYSLIPMQTASAAAVAKEVEQIIGGDNSPMSGVVRLVVISQLNAILIITHQPEYLAQMRGWIERLDQQAPTDERQVFIYHVQNGRASDIARTLDSVLGENSSSESDSAGTENTNGGSSGNGANDEGEGGNLLSTIGSSGSTQIPGMAPNEPNSGASPDQGAFNQSQSNPSGDVPSASDDQAGVEALLGGSMSTEMPPRITADDSDNALLIYATPGQYRSLEDALQQLDVEPLQVMIEAAVAEVTLTNQLQYGVQYFFQSGRVESLNTTASAASISPALPGFAAILSPSDNIQIILNALESITHVNVISAPKLLVLNNQPAELQVGDEVPITTQTAEGTTTADAPLVSTIQYQPTGVILHVTPRINDGGLVTLDISQEVSEVSATTSSTLNSPTISERKISTIVAVPDGQTVALGGLIQETDNRANGGIPGLDRIPVLGVLFSNHNNSLSRTELLVLITPHVVQTPGSLQAITNALQSELIDVQQQ